MAADLGVTLNKAQHVTCLPALRAQSGFSLGGWLIGGFLTIGYCLRTIGCCFPIVFWKFLWGVTRP